MNFVQILKTRNKITSDPYIKMGKNMKLCILYAISHYILLSYMYIIV